MVKSDGGDTTPPNTITTEERGVDGDDNDDGDRGTRSNKHAAQFPTYTAITGGWSLRMLLGCLWHRWDEDAEDGLAAWTDRSRSACVSCLVLSVLVMMSERVVCVCVSVCWSVCMYIYMER